MDKFTIIRKANPNRFPIRMGQFEGDPSFYVEEPDCEGYYHGDICDQFDTREAADKAFDDRVKELSETPNWEAQEAYDEIHGTINGYAPWQLEAREY